MYACTLGIIHRPLSLSPTPPLPPPSSTLSPSSFPLPPHSPLLLPPPLHNPSLLFSTTPPSSSPQPLPSPPPTAYFMVHQQEEKEADGPKSPLPHPASSTSILVSSASTVESRHYSPDRRLNCPAIIECWSTSGKCTLPLVVAHLGVRFLPAGHTQSAWLAGPKIDVFCICFGMHPHLHVRVSHAP